VGEQLLRPHGAAAMNTNWAANRNGSPGAGAIFQGAPPLIRAPERNRLHQRLLRPCRLVAGRSRSAWPSIDIIGSGGGQTRGAPQG
jgi:hypothetical protein